MSVSGGHFDYAYSRVRRFAEQLVLELARGDHRELTTETLLALSTIAQEAERTAVAMRAAEWLLSGDTSERTFLHEVRNTDP